jgi:hypothetical protein
LDVPATKAEAEKSAPHKTMLQPQGNKKMNNWMDGNMMWCMGWGGAFFILLLVLGVAALAKYLFFDKRQ